MTTRIKICGITRRRDAEAVVAAGADAMGLMFVEQSPRRVDVARAAALADAVSGRVTRVGVFMDPRPEVVRGVLDRVDLDLLQFHGAEDGAFCAAFGVPYMKVFRMREPLPVAQVESEYATACCVMLDTWVAGRPGGTGERFDWNLWPPHCRLPLVLAGGLNPDNVAAAVSRLDPWGVDVSGGVEGSVKGEKDAVKIARFVEEVRRARS